MTAKELVDFVVSKIGTAYVYGMSGTILTKQKYEQLRNLYGNLVWESDKEKIGQICCDCSGLIRWATGISRNSQGYFDTATKVESIDTIAKAPIGAAVWKKGHIGIYIGNMEYIAADGSQFGCRKNSIAQSDFTHWLLLKDIAYETEYQPEKSTIIVDGKTYTIERILYKQHNYIKIRDISQILGYEISNKGNIPILKKSK